VNLTDAYADLVSETGLIECSGDATAIVGFSAKDTSDADALRVTTVSEDSGGGTLEAAALEGIRSGLRTGVGSDALKASLGAIAAVVVVLVAAVAVSPITTTNVVPVAVGGTTAATAAAALSEPMVVVGGGSDICGTVDNSDEETDVPSAAFDAGVATDVCARVVPFPMPVAAVVAVVCVPVVVLVLTLVVVRKDDDTMTFDAFERLVGPITRRLTVLL